MNTQAEVFAAEALLDKRLRVNIPAPFFLQLIGVKVVPVWIKRPVYQQLLRMSANYVEMGIELVKLDSGTGTDLFQEIARHGVTASRIIAKGMIRSGWATFLFHRPLAYYLRCHMDARTMAELTKLVVVLSGGEDFSSIIRSVATMRVTAPTLSHKQTGS